MGVIMHLYSGLTTVSYGRCMSVAVDQPWHEHPLLPRQGQRGVTGKIAVDQPPLLCLTALHGRVAKENHAAATILIHARVVRRQNNPCVIFADEPLLQWLYWHSVYAHIDAFAQVAKVLLPLGGASGQVKRAFCQHDHNPTARCWEKYSQVMSRQLQRGVSRRSYEGGWPFLS